MYIHKSKEKFAILGGITLLLIVSLFLTFNSKLVNSQSLNIDYNSITKDIASYFDYVNYKSKLDKMGPIPVSEGNAKSIPVLLYHGIISEDSKSTIGSPDGINIPLKEFEDHMFALKKAGYQTVNMEGFQAFMRGEKQLPEKSFLLTFDDGRKDSYYPVDPLLKALDYKAVIFIIAKYPSRASNFYLDEDELKEMIKTGRWEIEAHAFDGHEFVQISSEEKDGHFYSNKLWLENQGRYETEQEYTERVSNDLEKVKQTLENMVGKNITAFAFPFGDYGQYSKSFDKAQKILLEQVKNRYQFAFYQLWTGGGHSQNYPSKGNFMVTRVDEQIGMTGTDLINILQRGDVKNLPHEFNSQNKGSWIRGWGILNKSNETLSLGIHNSMTYLDGSYLWENYSFNLFLKEYDDSTTLSLLARMQDPSNELSCDFSDGLIKISVEKERKWSTLAVLKDYVIPSQNVALGIKVKGDKAYCLVNGQSVLNASLPSDYSGNGGIGIKTWNPSTNTKQINIDWINVAALP